MIISQRILLVDDNEADNVYHEIMLRRAGFGGEVIVCESGEAAIDYLRTHPDKLPELVLLDINMPGMDGFEFARLATPYLDGDATATIVMLTSSASEADRRKAKQLPVIRGYIIKPLTEGTAVELLAGHFDSSF
ncbi:MAG: response regulator [Steroidobacteraceae bacterium]